MFELAANSADTGTLNHKLKLMNMTFNNIHIDVVLGRGVTQDEAAHLSALRIKHG